MLTEEDAREYAEAVAMVARHYDVGASAKTLDWINLGTTMAGIYGVRFITIAARRKAERAGRRPGPGHNGGPAMNSAGPDDLGPIDFSMMTAPPGGKAN